ncbi:MAG: hypothetical protein RL722_319 [Pseudomonadota bacterium]|jgi:DNA-binding response OmpR family regulator
MKILVVEDQPELRRLITRTLKRAEQHQFIEVADAAAGWEAALAHHPDLVLLDIMLPGTLDGLELCRRLRAYEPTAHAKIVIVSGRGHRNDLLIGQAAGADEYVQKPFSPAHLVDVIDNLMTV